MKKLENLTKEEQFWFKRYGFELYIKFGIFEYYFLINNSTSIKKLEYIDSLLQNHIEYIKFRVQYCKDLYSINKDQTIQLIERKIEEKE